MIVYEVNLVVRESVHAEYRAWLAAHVAVRRGAEFVRWMVIVLVVVSAVALFAGVGL